MPLQEQTSDSEERDVEDAFRMKEIFEGRR
jgi:hypothetical protein